MYVINSNIKLIKFKSTIRNTNIAVDMKISKRKKKIKYKLLYTKVNKI